MDLSKRSHLKGIRFMWNTPEGYPLHVEYSLTSDMGEQILEALRIMQHIGIDYLKANGMEHILEEKG